MIGLNVGVIKMQISTNNINTNLYLNAETDINTSVDPDIDVYVL